MTRKQAAMIRRRYVGGFHTICRGKSCACACIGCEYLKRQNKKRDRRFKKKSSGVGAA